MANLRIAELDFDEIKANFVDYLRSQNEFTDYDFEGSGLNVLLDILAYNTHYNAYLANMLMNEMFLDSAVKRSSVVSLAKHLGYTPRSVTGAVATVSLTVNNPDNTPIFLTLPRFTPFTSVIDGTSYTFQNLEPLTITPENGIYLFENVKIKEGTLLNYRYTSSTPGPTEKFEIPDDNVDIDSLYVTVQTSSTDTTVETFTKASTLVDLNANSLVYFVEENPFGRFQIYFGDDIIGKKLTAGNIVNIQYLSSSGSVCNVSGLVSQSFTTSALIGGSADIAIEVVSNSSGGGDRETIDSIKFNAPRFIQGRDRAVTKNDYSTLIKRNYPTIESVSVWGGEENIPPAYGKVFISLKPFSGFVVDDVVKSDIKNNILAERQMLTVQPEFVDPDYLFVNLAVNVKYNKNQTTKTAGEINVQVRSAIEQFFNNNLQQFDQPFYHSKLVSAITDSDASIVSALVDIRIQKRIIPVLNVANTFISNNRLKFNNPVHPGDVNSTRFFIVRNGANIPVKITDVPATMPPSYSGTGDLVLYDLIDNITLGTIGTVNYATGDMTITGLIPVAFPTGQFDIRINAEVQREFYDIVPLRNQIIVLDDSTSSTDANRTAGITINISSV